MRRNLIFKFSKFEFETLQSFETFEILDANLKKGLSF